MLHGGNLSQRTIRAAGWRILSQNTIARVVALRERPFLLVALPIQL